MTMTTPEEHYHNASATLDAMDTHDQGIYLYVIAEALLGLLQVQIGQNPLTWKNDGLRPGQR